MRIQRIAAFSAGATGGNPAGIVLCDTLPDRPVMQAMAAEIGYSETAFAARDAHGWRVRYFAPEIEVDFCGHATIALGTALARQFGDGVYRLTLNKTKITVEGRRDGAALQSPATTSRPISATLLAGALGLFGLTPAELDPRLPPALAHAGADHVILPLTSRATLAAMRYDLEQGRRWMTEAGLNGTISLVHAETLQRFHARNPFPIGGIYEDPATGAAAAALAGYLRDQGWPHGGAIEIIQGEDMGMASWLQAEIGPEPGGSIRVSGGARLLIDCHNGV